MLTVFGSAVASPITDGQANKRKASLPGKGFTEQSPAFTEKQP